MSDEYANQIKSAEAVGALGNDLFGDKTNLYTGVTDFSVVDVSLRGNDDLPVSIARRFSLRQSEVNRLDGIFADWDIDVPHLATVSYGGWRVNHPTTPNKRCSFTSPPPTVTHQGATWDGHEYWSGNQLYLPGQGEQEMLALVVENQNRPTTGGPYYWTTSGNWYFSCLSIGGDATNEGFLGLAPNGTRYWFDWGVSRIANTVQKTSTAPQLLAGAAKTLGPVNPILPRQEIWYLPTRIEDRFGNSVTFSYDSTERWRLNSINSSDGRQLTLSYNASGFVSSVTDGVRTWTYAYDGTGLRTVDLPGNNGTWQYSLDSLRTAQLTSTGGDNLCYGLNPIFPTTYTGTITHPSGAVGEFSFDTVRHGRSYVTENCIYTDYPVAGYAYYAYMFDTLALTRKKISGPGLTPAQWTYSYGSPNNSYAGECASGCPTTKTVEVAGPDSTWTRYTFGNKFLETDGKLLKTESGSGPTNILRVEDTTYQLTATDQNYPSRIGNSIYSRSDGTSERHAPLLQRQITLKPQQDTFTWHANGFDPYANPTSVTKSSSLGHTRTDITAYHYDTALWAIGQVASVTNTDTGAIESRTVYNNKALAEQVYSFEKLQQAFTYYGNGTLATIKDGNDKITAIPSWKRGIPESIKYPSTPESPAGATESAVVNNQGWIESVTDENGSTTSYGYDAMGRLASIAYPAETGFSWNGTARTFEPVGASEFGLPAGHWRQTISTGDARQITYFDAMWRPVLEETYDAADKANTLSQIVKRYDAEGRVVFQSYPSRTISSVGQTFASLGHGAGGGWYAAALLAAGQAPEMQQLPRAKGPVGKLLAPQYGSDFVSQSVPPSVTPGQQFSATIHMRNVGTETWTSGCELRSMNTTWGVSGVPIPFDIVPSDTGSFSIHATAPTTTGTYNFQWKMYCADFGTTFGDLSTNVAISVQPPPPTNNASYVSQAVPSPMTSGQSYTVTVQMQNTGTTTWTTAAGHKLLLLSPGNPSAWGMGSEVALPSSIAPGQTATFNVNVTAPAATGSYNFQWRMVQNSTQFGATTPIATTQVQAPPAPVDGATFVSQTVPSPMEVGSSHAVTVKMSNSGNTTWTSGGGYQLASANPNDNTRWGMSRVNLPATIAPGQTATFNFNVTAPTTVGTHAFQWQMIKGTTRFGALSTNVPVTVQQTPPPPVDDAAFEDQITPTPMQTGQGYALTVRMRNSGTTTWDAGTYSLKLLSPANPAAWGISGQIALPVSVAPGQLATFDVTAIAPAAGSYSFQWRMQKNSTAFGATTASAAVQVQTPPIPPLRGVRTVYDAIGRVIRGEQDSELGNLVTTTEYQSGFKTRVTNPRLVVTTTSYQAYDRPSQDWPKAIIQAEGLAEAAYTDIVRNVFGRPQTITRRNAAATITATRSYGYDVHQRLCRTVEPETGATLMGYDGAGNLAWSAAGLSSATPCEPDGVSTAVAARKVSRQYDARNRLKVLDFPDDLGNQSWTYWPDGLPASVATDNGGGNVVTNSYSYNNRRLLTNERLQWDSADWSLGYTYSLNGHLASQSHPVAASIGYAPNALGQPTQIGSYATGIRYYANGAAQQFTYGNGVIHTMLQNERQLPDRSIDSGGVLDDGYDYDANGNVAAISDGLYGARGDRDMTYDGLDRLAGTASSMYGATGAHYTYDVLDNLIRVQIGGTAMRDHYYCYDTQWRLTNIKTSSCAGTSVVGLGYDVQGNLANKNGILFGFDYGNRLRSVSSTPASTYIYDGHGRRVRDTTSASKYSFYSHAGQLAFVSDFRAAKYTNYFYLNGSSVAIMETPHGGGAAAIKYQHTDGIGTTVAVTNAGGSVTERSEYEPYGRILNRPIIDGLGYTGHINDAITGMVYMQQRYYDPEIGRFLSVDPITANNVAGNLNRYWYANGNPFKFSDPDGRLVENEFPSPKDDIERITPRDPYREFRLDDGGAGEETHSKGCDTTECDEVKATRAGVLQKQGETLEEAGLFGVKFAAINFGGGPLTRALGKLGRLIGFGGKFMPTAEKIAGGHAFTKHGAQFTAMGVRNEKQFARFINRIMENPSAVRQLRNGRTAYWDDATGTVVIHNPNAADAGTAFMPTIGRTYFDEVLK